MRKDRIITEVADMLDVIERCQVIRIGMRDEDGGVYILPMNFGHTYENDTLTFYLHGAVKGKKVDLLRQNPVVGFELDCDHRLVEGRLPCQYGFKYASVVGKGTAELLENPQEKIEAMKLLMKCISGKDFEFNEKLVSIVSLIKITAVSFTGKHCI